MILPCQNVDPEIFFQPTTIRKARNLCRACPALKGCMDFTREMEEKVGRQQGVWAGMSVGERRRLYPVLVERPCG